MTEIGNVSKFKIRILFKIKTCLPCLSPACRQTGQAGGRQVQNSKFLLKL